MIKSGIAKLDEHLNGGFQDNAKVLIISSPGLDNRIFAYHIMAANNTNVEYILENTFPTDLRKDFGRYLFPEEVMKKTALVDAFTTGLGLPSEEKYFAKDSTKIDSVIEAIEKAKETNPGIYIIDSLSGLIAKHQKIDKIYEIMSNTDGLKIALYTSWTKEDISTLEEKFDYIIELRSIEDRLLTRSYFRVRKAPGEFKDNAVPYRVSFDGVAVYVPKIIITGPFHAGKTTFIHKVSTKAVSVNRMGTTIALDHGYIEHSGLSVDIFGTPGQERFEFMLDILNKDAFGVLLIVDSTKPETFERAKEMLKHVSRYNLPFIVAANKQDLPSALKPEEVKQRLGMNVEVVGTVATTGEGCMEALKRLIDIIVEGSI